MKRKTRNLLKAGFVLYAVLMLWLLFGQRMGRDLFGTYWEVLESNINLMPFRTIGRYMDTLNNSGYRHAFHSVINLAGNVGMFVPLGFFIPCVFTRYNTFWRCLSVSAITVAVVELVQLFTLLGSCDIDDLILNMAGAAVGYGIYFLLRKVIFK